MDSRLTTRPIHVFSVPALCPRCHWMRILSLSRDTTGLLNRVVVSAWGGCRALRDGSQDCLYPAALLGLCCGQHPVRSLPTALQPSALHCCIWCGTSRTCCQPRDGTCCAASMISSIFLESSACSSAMSSISCCSWKLLTTAAATDGWSLLGNSQQGDCS